MAPGLHFGLKLSNTLEVENWRTVFPADSMMYLSGGPLHALTANLALLLAEHSCGPPADLVRRRRRHLQRAPSARLRHAHRDHLLGHPAAGRLPRGSASTSTKPRARSSGWAPATSRTSSAGWLDRPPRRGFAAAAPTCGATPRRC